MRSIPRREGAFALAALAAALTFIAPARAQPALASSPAPAAYGQAVSVELKGSGIALYRPATRYTRSGSAMVFATIRHALSAPRKSFLRRCSEASSATMRRNHRLTFLPS